MTVSPAPFDVPRWTVVNSRNVLPRADDEPRRLARDTSGPAARSPRTACAKMRFSSPKTAGPSSCAWAPTDVPRAELDAFARRRRRARSSLPRRGALPAPRPPSGGRRRSRAVDQAREQLRLGAERSPDLGGRAALRDPAPDREHLDFHDELVAGHDRPAELAAVDARSGRELLLAVREAREQTDHRRPGPSPRRRGRRASPGCRGSAPGRTPR